MMILFIKKIYQYNNYLCVFYRATHPLSNLKGFEPKLCFGDILMSFVWSGGIFEEDTGGKQPM